MGVPTLLLFIVYLFCIATAANPSFVIQWNNTKQRIDGFGASCAMRQFTPPSNVMDLLFNKNVGIGLTLLRSRVSQNLPNATTELAWALAMKNYSVPTWSTVWSPPAQWKSNNNVNNGGYLLPQYYNTYADYLVTYVENLLLRGVQLFALSINNEPDNAPGYESCLWNATQMYDFVKILAPKLKARNLKTRIMVGESSTWDFALATKLLDDSTTSSLVDIVATHAYGGAAIPSPFAYAKTAWMTEWCDGRGTWDPSIIGGLIVAIKIHEVLSHSQLNAFHYWWTSDSESVKDNQGLLGPRPNYEVSKRLYALGQFSKFIRPNWVRIQVTPGNVGQIYVSAYRHATNGSFAIVVINNNNVTSSIVLSLAGDNFVGIRTLTPYVTSATQNITKGSLIAVSTARTVSLNLAAQTITTYLGCARPGTVAAPAAPSTINFVKNGGYENGSAVGSWVARDNLFVVQTSVVRSGRYAAKFTHDRNPSINLLPFNFVPGTFFYVSTWVKKVASGIFNMEMWVTLVLDGKTNWYHINDASENGVTPVWLHVVGGFFIPYGNVTTLNVYLQGPTAGSVYYIDDTSITFSQTTTNQGYLPISVSNENSGICPAWTGPTPTPSV